jgi:acyl-CoA hydrolase
MSSAKLNDSASPQNIVFRSRKMVKPEDLNGRDTLFGGRLLAWIDEECAIYSACQMGSDSIVTKYISEMNFQAPAYKGDVIEIGVAATEVGTSSLTLTAVVRDKVSKREIITIDKIVFVRVDREGRAAPHNMKTRRAARAALAPQRPDIVAA